MFWLGYKQVLLPSVAKQVFEKQVTPELLYKLRLSICSRPTFFVNFVRKLFSSKERRESNMKGKRRKNKLDEAKIQAMKENAFNLFVIVCTPDLFAV